ncbi:MAG: hypothetical protein C4293_09490 [Nitrospiraceae bacterium]
MPERIGKLVEASLKEFRTAPVISTILLFIMGAQVFGLLKFAFSKGIGSLFGLILLGFLIIIFPVALLLLWCFCALFVLEPVVAWIKLHTTKSSGQSTLRERAHPWNEGRWLLLAFGFWVLLFLLAKVLIG